MTTFLRRAALVSAASLVVAAFLPASGGAQTEETTTETTISYAADASSTGFLLAITPPESDPALAVTAAGTEGSITSDGPAASGSAEVAALADTSAARAATSAPPDETAQEQSQVPAASIPLGPLGTVDLGAIQGEATSASEAADGFPSTENDASFSGAEIDLGVTLPDPFGAVGGNVTVLGGSTSSDAVANEETDVAASAAASGLGVSANLDIEALDQVCAQLPPGPLQDACQALVGTGEPAAIDVTVGSSNVECAWDGAVAECTGGAAVATIEALGQDPVEVAPGETVTIPPDPGPNDPFLVRVSLGTFEAEASDDVGGSGATEAETHEASGIATGFSVELLGAAASGPGLITVEAGESTAGVSSRVASREIIARTGGTVVPLLVGGTVLVVLGVSLRRYLKRA